MCELLGMSFNLPITPSVSFRGFRHRGKENPDGWGIAFYLDEASQIVKEPVNILKSKILSAFVDKLNIKSKIFIGHVRKMSSGKKIYKDTHPFSREMHGREYVFAHNGTIEGFKNLKLDRFSPIGGTDSEYIFCYLLDMMWSKNIFDFDDLKSFEWLFEMFVSINESGKLNLILSDGKYLICYHDKNGYKGLNFLERKSPYGKIKLLDEDWEINLDYSKSDLYGYIIATNPLTSERWESFKKGEMKVFKDGKMICSFKD